MARVASIQGSEEPIAGHSGLKGRAIAWLEARMQEAWQRRKTQMSETLADRAQRRRIGQLMPAE